MRDFAQVKNQGVVTREITEHALGSLEVDHMGLEPGDIKILLALIEKFNGGPVGLKTIAASLSEEEATIEEVNEPYLMQLGFLERTPRGRTVTSKGHAHAGEHTKKQKQTLL